ncbi:heat stress transcription factor A-5 [Tanacetum coccineum]
MADRPTSKQGMKNEASTSKANSNDMYTSRHQNKDANVVNTSNTFEVLNNLDERKNNENVPILQSMHNRCGSGYKTKSLYERGKETKDDDPYDYDPYDDDDVEYNSHILSKDQSAGFIKIDPEKWEFANEGFLKDKNHLLKNIHRRKPVHSHSTPQTSTVDPERAAFEEEIDKLTREKASLEKNLLRYKQQQPASKLQLEDLTQRVNSMEQRQDALLTFLKKAARYPEFVEHLAQKLESIDFQPITRKEDGGSPQFRSSEGCTRTTEATPGRLLELSDTCTTLGFNMGSSLTHKTGPTLDTKEETEVHPSCQLNLTLASSVSQINPCQKNDTIPQSFDDIGKPPRENVPSNQRSACSSPNSC